MQDAEASGSEWGTEDREDAGSASDYDLEEDAGDLAGDAGDLVEDEIDAAEGSGGQWEDAEELMHYAESADGGEEEESYEEEVEDDGEDVQEPLAAPIDLKEGSAEAIARALAANRKLQARLEGVLEAVDGAIWRNAETQAKLTCNSEAYPRAGRYRGMQAVSSAHWESASMRAVGPSRFWVAGRRVPEPNQDAVRLAPAFRYLPHSFKEVGWQEEERVRLGRAILLAVKRVRSLKRLRASGGDLHASAAAVEKGEEALTLNSAGVEAEVDAFSDARWEEVAKSGTPGRSREECAKEWARALRPSSQRGPWTEQEDRRLLQLCRRHGLHAWEKVAQALGTGRTPAMCLSRYQTHHNAQLLAAKWTPEDAARLKAIVALHGTGDWNTVSAEMGNRTAEQVMHYYKDNLTAFKKGDWLPEEDAALLRAVEACGRKWREVERRMGSRSDKQCRERYCNVLDPAIKHDLPWEPAEDEKLLSAIAEHTQPNGKIRWAKISAKLPGRTDNHCARRSRALAAAARGYKRKQPPRNHHGRFLKGQELSQPEEDSAAAEEGAAQQAHAEGSQAEGAQGSDGQAQAGAAGEDAADGTERATMGKGGRGRGKAGRGRGRGRKAAAARARAAEAAAEPEHPAGAEEVQAQAVLGREDGGGAEDAGRQDAEQQQQGRGPKRRCKGRQKAAEQAQGATALAAEAEQAVAEGDTSPKAAPPLRRQPRRKRSARG